VVFKGFWKQVKSKNTVDCYPTIHKQMNAKRTLRWNKWCLIFRIGCIKANSRSQLENRIRKLISFFSPFSNNCIDWIYSFVRNISTLNPSVKKTRMITIYKALYLEHLSYFCICSGVIVWAFSDTNTRILTIEHRKLLYYII
jgi:hypothetical protein